MLKVFLFILFCFSSIYSVGREELISLVTKNICENYKVDSVDVEIYSPEKVISSLTDKQVLYVSKATHGYKSFQKYKIICDGFSKKITFKINFYKELPVAKEELLKDKVIEFRDISYEMINISEAKNFIEDENLIIGKMCKRKFRKGDYFQKPSLKDTPLVIKDASVKVVVKNNLVNLSFDAVAFGSGYKGDRVYFRNPFSGELQLGTVVALNLIKL